MDKEYRANQRKQKRTFKKYRKYIGRVFLWAGIGLASALFFPGGAIMGALKGLMGEYLAGSLAFFGQWGIAAAGLVGSIVNGIKAHNAAKTIDDSQEEEENIVDCMVRDKEQLERKVDNLSKTKVKEEENVKTAELKIVKGNTSITDDKEVERHKPLFTVLKGGKTNENSETLDSDEKLARFERAHFKLLKGGRYKKEEKSHEPEELKNNQKIKKAS